MKMNIILIFIIVTLNFCSELSLPDIPNIIPENLLLITGSDFSTGFLSAYSLDNNEIYQDIYPTHSDAVVRVSKNKIFVVNRLGEDNIMRYSSETNLNLMYEKSTGSQSNPQSIAVINENSSLVTLNNKNYILMVDTSTGNMIGEIDLSKYADADQFCETSEVLIINNKAYITIQRLNRHKNSWPPVGDSYLLKINTSDFEIEKELVLPFNNPISKIRYNTLRNSIIITASGNFGSNYLLDGGVIEYNILTDSFMTSLIRETEAGFEITDAVLINNSIGFLIGQRENLNSVFAVFDINEHKIVKILSELSSSIGGFYSDVLFDIDKVYLSDRNALDPKVRIFSVDTLEEINSISIGLPPFSIDMLK